MRGEKQGPPGAEFKSTAQRGGVAVPVEGFRRRRAPGVVTLALLAGTLPAGLAQASAYYEGNAVLYLGGKGFGVTADGSTSGNSIEIDHELGNETLPAASQSLVVDFGTSVYDVAAVLADFGGNDNQNSCIDAGSWYAFDAVGFLVGSGYFTSVEGTAVDVGAEPLRYLAFTAEPNPNRGDSGCPDTNNTSSDYIVESISFATENDDTSGAATYTVTSLKDSTLDTYVVDVAGGSGSFALNEDDFYAYDPEEPFLSDPDGSLSLPEPVTTGDERLIFPDGSVAGQFRIAPEECEGGDGTGTGDQDQDCVIRYNDDFSSIFAAGTGIVGTLSLARPIETIDDPRGACGGSEPGTTPRALVLDGVDYPSVYPTTTPAAGGFLTIPPYLCGIPNADGQPQFVIIDLDSDLIVDGAVIQHLIRTPQNTPDPGNDYLCREPGVIDRSAGNDQRPLQPVMGWLPKANEIPVLEADGFTRINVTEDLTSGCGSYRGGTGRASYLLYNLAHLSASDYVAIVGAEIDQLRNTVSLTEPCVSNGKLQSSLSSAIDKIERWFGRGDNDQFARAKDEVEAFRQILIDLDKIANGLSTCYYNSSTEQIQYVAPGEIPGEGLVPRNFRGDLITQADHIIYMLETFLGAQ